MAKKRFLSMQPHLEGLRAIPGRRALRQRRTRAGLALLMLLIIAMFVLPMFVPLSLIHI